MYQGGADLYVKNILHYIRGSTAPWTFVPSYTMDVCSVHIDYFLCVFAILHNVHSMHIDDLICNKQSTVNKEN